jgi:hypothetical protein
MSTWWVGSSHESRHYCSTFYGMWYCKPDSRDALKRDADAQWPNVQFILYVDSKLNCQRSIDIYFTKSRQLLQLSLEEMFLYCTDQHDNKLVKSWYSKMVSSLHLDLYTVYRVLYVLSVYAACLRAAMLGQSFSENAVSLMFACERLSRTQNDTVFICFSFWPS